MKIGIDISQLAYQRTGVANFLSKFITELILHDQKNEYILFFSGFRGKLPHFSFLSAKNVTVKKSYFSPQMLDLMWNKLHRFPIEFFVGNVDIFITSDWTEPPTIKAKKATILYDLIIYKYPEETDRQIREVQKRKLHWVKKESSAILCISQSTKQDAKDLLSIEDARLQVIYPGL